MERKSLDDILHCVTTGRAVSPAGVRKAAIELMETPVSQMVNADYEGREFWTTNLFLYAHPVREKKIYWDVAGGIIKQAVLHQEMSVELYILLTYLHACGSGSVKKWLSFGVEDVMREAGLESQYEQWFLRESVMWEKEYGRVPSVGDIMKTAYDQEWVEGVMVKPYMERPSGYFPEDISEPFRRSLMELGVKHLSLKSNVEEAKYKHTRLRSTWMWLLMVEAPARIYCNCTQE